jgi:hypothetical protein
MKLFKNPVHTVALISIAGLLHGFCLSATAADRPFLDLDTAMVEDDDERSFEFSSWVVNHQQERGLQAALEYNFNPTLSAELELGWAKNKDDGSRERSAEIGLRKVWLDPAREGFGLGTNISVGWARPDDAGWKYESLRAVMTYSLPLLEKQVWLHANAGVERTQEDGLTHRLWAAGVQASIRKDVTLFSEYAQRANKDAAINGGARWWAKKDKIALDLSVGRVRPQDADSRNFMSLGISFYDLNF